MAPTSSSASFLDENHQKQVMMLQQQQPSAPPPPQKKKKKRTRNQPGHPNPEAEVIALSPKTLMATNRFICEVCNKGFQREQNLQLHRRGHNLPWKLKQKSTDQPVKKKVYLCPEPSCVHHHPSRALGDLTGIKKHYFRKHGEKKWKCNKCSKRYAVQSDLKAHSKICGTREYTCDCGTLFSRRDSFITHRAFCDALTQESARHNPSSFNTFGGGTLNNNNNISTLGLSQSQMSILQPPSNMLRLGTEGSVPPKYDHLIPSSANYPSNSFFKTENIELGFDAPFGLSSLMHNPNILVQGNNNYALPSNMFNLGFFGDTNNNAGLSNTSNNSNSTSSNFPASSGLLSPSQFSSGNGGGGGFFSDAIGERGFSSMYNPDPPLGNDNNMVAHMSATALIQKAAQMGSITSSCTSSSMLGFGGASGGTSMNPQLINFDGDFQKLPSQIMENENPFRGLINSLTNGSGSSSLFGCKNEQDGNYGGFNILDHHHQWKTNNNLASSSSLDNMGGGGVSIGGSDSKLTLDFLGVGGFVRKFASRDQKMI